MSDPIAITSIIVAIGTMIGGVFGYFHFKLNSNCCSCCKFECTENQHKRRKSLSPPETPIKLEPIKKEEKQKESEPHSLA
jgi:hypothetical protein